jgi:hypothetical protein
MKSREFGYRQTNCCIRCLFLPESYDFEMGFCIHPKVRDYVSLSCVCDLFQEDVRFSPKEHS